MKTSTKLLLSAIVLLIIGIGVYNNALKAEYLTGNYKSPYHNFKKLNVKYFSEVEINAANIIDIEIKQGPFAIYKGNHNQDSLIVKQTGKKLTIDLNMPEMPEMATEYKSGKETKKFISEYRNDKIIIVCPNLSMLKTDDYFFVQGKKLPAYNYSNSTNLSDYRMIYLNDFTLDSLTLLQNGRSRVELSVGNIKVFKAVVSRKSGLEINTGNMLGSADFKINAGSVLTLSDVSSTPNGKQKADAAMKQLSKQDQQLLLSPKKGELSIPKLTYQISDSARVNVSGSMLKLFTKQQ